MNYFNRNRLITIFLVALMVINIAALFTIAVNSRIFSKNKSPKMESRTNRDRGSFRERERSFSEGISKRLGLSEEQQARMDELRLENKGKMKLVMDKMNETRKELNEAMGSRILDLEKIEALNLEVASLDKVIRENLLEYNIKVRELLDEEQLDRYLEMHKNKRRKGGSSRRGAPMELIQIYL